MPDEPDEDIRKLAELLAKQEFRHSFHGRIEEGLRAHGKDPGKIPQALLEALNHLSEDELRAVSDANIALEGAGLTGEKMTRFPALLKLPV